MLSRSLIPACLALSGCLPDYSPDVLGRDAAQVLDASRRDTAVPPPQEQLPEVDAAVEPIPDAARANGCDLSGSWLLTERMVSSAFGADQVIRLWWYLELAQQGDALTVTRSLSCGQQSVGLPPFSVEVDDSSSWAAYLQHPTYEGRTGRSVATGSDCAIEFDKGVIIRGSTVEAYRDLDVPMPTLEEEATAVSPGWEDWDQDGKPGISVDVRGTVNGTIYITSRAWTEAKGSSPAAMRSFTLPLDWEMQRVTLGIEGSPLLSSAIAPSPNAQHIAQFTRLSASQSAGDSDTLCATVRELAPTLTPDAMKTQ